MFVHISNRQFHFHYCFTRCERVCHRTMSPTLHEHGRRGHVQLWWWIHAGFHDDIMFTYVRPRYFIRFLVKDANVGKVSWNDALFVNDRSCFCWNLKHLSLSKYFDPMCALPSQCPKKWYKCKCISIFVEKIELIKVGKCFIWYFPACEEGKWGPGCSNTCGCSANTLTCDPVQGCVNCKPGWRGDYNCKENIKECQETPDICGDKADCMDTQGSYECTCHAGYAKNGNGSCVGKTVLITPLTNEQLCQRPYSPAA